MNILNNFKINDGEPNKKPPFMKVINSIRTLDYSMHIYVTKYKGQLFF